jgi:DNA-binding response OmpR family regulator
MGKIRIAIVDDEEDLLEELEETFRLNSYDVEAISDATAASELIAKSRPDVVLLDLEMKGKNGFQIADELSHNPVTAEIPIIAMTGLYRSEDRENLRITGRFEDLLIKPFAISDVLEMIKEVRRLQ